MLKPFLSKQSLDRISLSSKLIDYVDQTEEYNIIGSGILSKNGHISWGKDENILLNDSYDDKDGCRHLELFNVKKIN